MTNRERLKAILHYENADRVPVVHFGFWTETLNKWANEGHITWEIAKGWADGNFCDKEISDQLGIDANYNTLIGINTNIYPSFNEKVIEEKPDGSKQCVIP